METGMVRMKNLSLVFCLSVFWGKIVSGETID